MTPVKSVVKNRSLSTAVLAVVKKLKDVIAFKGSWTKLDYIK